MEQIPYSRFIFLIVIFYQNEQTMYKEVMGLESNRFLNGEEYIVINRNSGEVFY